MTLEETPQALHEANAAAERIVKGWIQKTFHETSLQCLRQQLQNQGANMAVDFEITSSMLDQCHLVCQRLAYHWEKRLNEANQPQVATWVSEVASRGQFWHDANTNVTANTTKVHESSQSRTNTNVDNMPRGLNYSEPRRSEISEEEELSFATHLHLPLAKMRHMFSTCNDLKMWDTVLNSMGKSGNTQWPLDWTIVQNYCEEQLIHRLHARTPRVTFEVVPKDLVQNDDDDDVIQSKKLKALLKRKALDGSAQSQQLRKFQKSRNQDNETTEKPRPPSDHPEIVVWDWASTKDTIQNKEALVATLVHSDTEPDPPITLLGAVRWLGHTRLARSTRDTTLFTEKQHQRALTASTKQRLGGLVVLRDFRKTPMSKVVRAQSNGSHFLELDVGECLLEWRGMLFAFSTVEISLKDEDKSSSENDDMEIAVDKDTQ